MVYSFVVYPSEPAKSVRYQRRGMSRSISILLIWDAYNVDRPQAG